MGSYWVRRPRQNKYGNKKTELDGYIFDSKAEARRYAELKIMEKAGQISKLERQKEYELIPAFRDAAGRKHRATKYVADFCYMDKAGNEIIEDVKSEATRKDSTYRLKRKMMAYCLGLIIREVE